MGIYIPTRSNLGWAYETSYDADPDTLVDMTEYFGVHDEDVELPDPENKFNYYRFCGHGPDIKTAVLVSRELTGTIPFLLHDGRMLAFAVGGDTHRIKLNIGFGGLNPNYL